GVRFRTRHLERAVLGAGRSRTGRAELPAEDATQLYGAGVISRVGGTPRDPGAVLLRAVTRLRELHGVVRLRLRHRRAWIFRRCPDPRQREEQHGAASERSY